ncbi:ankyrin repeat domain-containing protein [Lysinibacter cavernae]|uniref:Ankyrin repeat protein n=1 Tax=Lysinibacter cavernae TaxID=1640652 RepID=A0A7X5TT61_9MICO|nr:ankyrin repeat domain-containing protein [Lysinibacter cavernae]NIH52958.1 ankyrin repeat protein [Lysinibacter cavernae]
MKTLFLAIRAGDFDKVESLLDRKPELVGAIASPPPKKDTGQQPLGVAIKTRHLAIAQLLLDRGADVNFIEAEGVEGRMPVIIDAIDACVATVVGPAANEERAASNLAFLRTMIDAGAVVTRAHPDTGNPLLVSAFRTVNYWATGPCDQAQLDRLSAVFRVLIEAGADPDEPFEWVDVMAATKERIPRGTVTPREALTKYYRQSFGELMLQMLAMAEAEAPRRTTSRLGLFRRATR